MTIPLIEQVKIQAQVLIPLVRALQAELGPDRANDLVRAALGEQFRKFGEKWWRAQGDRTLGEKMRVAFDGFAEGGAMDYEVLRDGEDAFDVDVKGCRYAEFYKRIGAPELGFLLVCDADVAMAKGYGSDGASGVTFARTRTIMQGADHCDFRYALNASQSPAAKDGNMERTD